jgi:hypothetical protein
VLRAPDDPGSYLLEIDLVHEHVRWFDCPLQLTIDVEPRRWPTCDPVRRWGQGAGPRVSVIVCTRNRAGQLRCCLDAIAEQSMPEAQFETIVVDNGSTDATSKFLEGWAAERPDKRRVVVEPVVGLSRARNTGLREARSPIAAFLDDDAVAPTGWVAAHAVVYDRWPDTDAVGGPVVCVFPEVRPDWLSPTLEHWWSALDLGHRALMFPPPHGPYGTNMSMRRERVMALGGFPPSLGRRGRSLMSAEEAAVWTRLWAGKGVIRYEPSAVIAHHLESSRLTRRWMVRRGIAQGRSNARLNWIERQPQPQRLAPAVAAEWRSAVVGSRDVARLLASGTLATGELLNETARRAGHVAAIAEHLQLAAAALLRGPS